MISPWHAAAATGCAAAPATPSQNAPSCATTMTYSAAARARGRTRRTAAAPSPNASPRTLRDAVFRGVSGRATPITATLVPPRSINVHDSAQSGRAVPAESVMFAPSKR